MPRVFSFDACVSDLKVTGMTSGFLSTGQYRDKKGTVVK